MIKRLQKIGLLCLVLLLTNLINAQVQRVRINFINSQGYTSQILLGFDPNDYATDGYDYGWDSKPPSYPPDALYWLINNDEYIIQGVGSFSVDKSYPLGLFLTNTGDIKIHLTELENFDSNIDVFIHNTEDDTYFQINDKDYSSYEVSGAHLNKYRIAFKIPENVKSSLTEEDHYITDELVVKSIKSTNELIIDGLGKYNVQSLTLHNYYGQQVFKTSSIGSARKKIYLPHLSNQILIASVQSDKGSISKKIIL
jgi:hypothetical protein